ncbi:uncharacterized protein LOC116189197 [Punica granatum]|uniref:RRM domain-containing protein n=2 Tax=Punica granatum TaxID=22663 RepID=A0A218XP22_PUNGR|nr:uncharacterized protein LOC116189197 [Punica granatum]OWM86703.1 hypothetical protein CDL15_Pgr015739 [Punica granatum]PKI75672.1 hypothetical protein CRG98_003932 [Punica granatum]
MTSLRTAELYAFHHVDRQVFTKMVKDLLRDPGESLLVIALWLWLERKGYPKIIVKLASLPDFLVYSAAQEAALCLKCLENTPPFPISRDGGFLPLTSRVMERNLALQFFQDNKFSAICGIRSMLTNVCSRIFTDILEHHLGNPTQAALNQPLLIPGFPHPLYGDLVIVLRPPDHNLPARDPWAWDPMNDVDECDRTVFLTFSRGFPVSKEEVRELFSEVLGLDCVSDVVMQETPKTSEQCLYAKLVLNSVESVDRVLTGRKVAKFQINGKHIWARKYERRD